jgi:folate-binding Fe-S cluster repair protein YgfZ
MNTAVDLPTSPATARAPRAELDALLRVPVWCALDDDLGVIAVRGPDAVTFLQGQLTNDSKTLGAAAVQLTGYCTAKGRLLAVFEQWRTEDADGEVLLQLPREILPTVLKRLSMFVLRAKAKLTDDSAQWRTIAVVGAGSGQALRCGALYPAGADRGQRCSGHACRACQPAPGRGRGLVVVTGGRSGADRRGWDAGGLRAADDQP